MFKLDVINSETNEIITENILFENASSAHLYIRDSLNSIFKFHSLKEVNEDLNDYQKVKYSQHYIYLRKQK